MSEPERFIEIRDTSSRSISIINKIMSMRRLSNLNSEEIILVHKTITKIETELLSLDRCLDIDPHLLNSEREQNE